MLYGNTDKVLPITDNILGTMAGGAADCGFWIRYLSAMFRTREDGATATAAACVLSRLFRSNPGLSVGTMVMGFDERGDPCITYVDDAGAMERGFYFSVGSGSPYAISVLDSELRPSMTLGEATEVAFKAILEATHRDAFSGGYINVYHLCRNRGWRQVRREDSGCVFSSVSGTADKNRPMGESEDGGSKSASSHPPLTIEPGQRGIGDADGGALSFG